MRNRRRYTPSSSHKLAELVTEIPIFSRTPGNVLGHLKRPCQRESIARLAGPLTDWAISQLSTKPFVVIGWPNPCKAARMSMRRKAGAR